MLLTTISAEKVIRKVTIEKPNYMIGLLSRPGNMGPGRYMVASVFLEAVLETTLFLD